MFTRRKALDSLVVAINGLIAGTLAVPVLGYLLTPVLRRSGAGGWAALGPLEDFRGAAPRRADYRYTSEAGYVAESVRAFAYVLPGAGEGGAPVVLSPVCTHMGCNVEWSDEKREFLCPCHGGRYAADGRNVGGPPPRPLDRLAARVEDGVLLIRTGGAS